MYTPTKEDLEELWFKLNDYEANYDIKLYKEESWENMIYIKYSFQYEYWGINVPCFVNSSFNPESIEDIKTLIRILNK